MDAYWSREFEATWAGMDTHTLVSSFINNSQTYIGRYQFGEFSFDKSLSILKDKLKHTKWISLIHTYTIYIHTHTEEYIGYVYMHVGLLAHPPPPSIWKTETEVPSMKGNWQIRRGDKPMVKKMHRTSNSRSENFVTFDYSSWISFRLGKLYDCHTNIVRKIFKLCLIW